MKVTVCIGSSCHIKGSRPVLEQLKKLIADENMDGRVEVDSTFCMGECGEGVCVAVDEKRFSVSPENVLSFFETEIKARA